MPQLGRPDTHAEKRVRPTIATPVRIVSATADASVLTVTFDQPVVLTLGNVPQYTTDVAGPSPLSATSPTIESVAVTFSADISAATIVNIPYLDPAVRSRTGGFVSDSTFPVA